MRAFLRQEVEVDRDVAQHLAERRTEPITFGDVAASSYAQLAVSVAAHLGREIQAYCHEVGHLYRIGQPEYNFTEEQVEELRRRLSLRGFSCLAEEGGGLATIRRESDSLVAGLVQESQWGGPGAEEQTETSSGSDQEPKAPPDEQVATLPQLAKRYSLDDKQKDRLRKRLASWRKSNFDGGWIEVRDPKRNEPRYLYPVAKIQGIIDKVK